MSDSSIVKAQDVATWTPEQRELIRRTCAPGATDDELSMYLHVAERSGLDPLRKQLHFMKVGGRVTFIADVNGLQARAAREPDFGGIDHAVVYEGDDFLFDQKTGEVVKHVNNPFKAGKPLGAWAIVHRKGKRPFVSCVRFAEYFNPSNPLWKEGAKPSVMIDKCAKSTALRLAYPEQFSGIYDRAELGKEEKEINPPPAPAPINGNHAKEVTKALKSGPRLQVVDVKAGETEDEAKARTAKEAAPSEPAPWEKLEIFCRELGIEPTAGWMTLRALQERGAITQKFSKKADLDAPSLALVKAEIQKAYDAKKMVETRLNEPPPPGDEDAHALDA